MKNILIVDDSKLVLKALLARTLSGKKLRPVLAANFQQAQAAVESDNDFFVAIADLILPDCGETELVEYLLSKNIPTIVLSGSIDNKLRSMLLARPIVDYIVKSGAEDLRSAISLAELLLFNKKIKALVLSENKTFANEMGHFLSNLLIDTIFCQSPDEIPEILTNDTKIKILIVPNSVTGTSGPDVVKKLRDSYLETLVVFGVTTSDDSETRYKFLKSGADDCLIRPFYKEEFNARIMNLIRILSQKEQIEKQLKIVDKNIITSSTDEKGIIKTASEAFSSVSGFAKEELIGNNHNIVRHPDNSKEFYKNLWDTISAGKPWQGEFKNKKKDGGFYWVRANIEPDFDYDGTISGYTAIRQDITDKILVEEKSKELEEAQQKIMDSIRFSSLIQDSLLPDESILDEFFKESLIIWEPKDIVGGDTYYFYKDEDCCYVMVLDCTGHGVPGAFMTMLVTSILNNLFVSTYRPAPSSILSALNKNIKETLKQYSRSAKSDAGLDGGVLRYDRSDNTIVYSGAKCELFCFADGELNIVKGDRHSVGYIKSDPEYKFSEKKIAIDKEMLIYLSTDGFIDQNGGEKGFPMGKKKFTSLLKKNLGYSMDVQGQNLLEALDDHQRGNERNDDVTLVGFKVVPQKVDTSIIISHKGELTQELIKEYTDKLENELEKIVWAKKKTSRVLITFVEMIQNVFKYSLSQNSSGSYKDNVTVKINQAEEQIVVETLNLTDSFSSGKILEDVMSINMLDKDEIKKLYRDMRKSGDGSHDIGAGIGFIEIAKQTGGNISAGVERCDKNQCVLHITAKV